MKWDHLNEKKEEKRGKNEFVENDEKDIMIKCKKYSKFSLKIMNNNDDVDNSGWHKQNSRL